MGKSALVVGALEASAPPRAPEQEKYGNKMETKEHANAFSKNFPLTALSFILKFFYW